MKFSMYFDVISCVSTRKSDARKKRAVMESKQVSNNPREGRYFTKPEKEPVVEESEEDVEETPEKTDAEEKPIGEEIPEPSIDEDEEKSSDEPIQEETPKEDDEDLYASESTSEEDIESEESYVNGIINDMLKDFSTDLDQEEDTTPAEESVGRETPLIPSVLREIEAEDSETPIPLNVAATVKKETANTKVDPTTYVDKKEDKDKKYVEKMIRDFVNVPISRKKEYANTIYKFIIDNNVNIELSKYRTIWKLVDKPFIVSKDEGNK